jgi:ACS family glucarate transporter-like MFS transporter
MTVPKAEIMVGVGDRPTSVRYAMIALAMSMAVLLYLDRICLSTAAEFVGKDLGIDEYQLNWLLGAFFWTYALGQLPAGWLGDRFGARWMLGSYAILWSLCTGLMGIANSFGILLALRLGCGLFEAGAYPVAASIVRRWIPIERRGIASSFVAVGGRLGGALAPILTVQLMLWSTLGDGWWSAPAGVQASVTSWRPVMMLYGWVGIVVAIIFLWRFRDSPQEHPRVNLAEVDLIRRGEPSASLDPSSQTSPLPFRSMFLSSGMWANCGVQFVSNFGWAFLVTKMPQYLRDVHESTLQSQGLLQSLPLIAGILGLMMGGWLTDYCSRRMGPRWGRSIAMAGSRFIVGLAFLGCLVVDTSIEATLCLALVGLATDLGTPACWAYGQDVGGRHVGSVVGWANMWGNFGAALSPVILGAIVGQFSEIWMGWHFAFLFCAILNLLAAVMALQVDSSKTLQA